MNDEPEYFVTLNLGKVYGPKLVRLAVLSRRADDLEEFAALLLCGALDYLEAELQKEESADEDHPAEERNERGGPLDDGIPF